MEGDGTPNESATNETLQLEGHHNGSTDHVVDLTSIQRLSLLSPLRGNNGDDEVSDSAESDSAQMSNESPENSFSGPGASFSMNRHARRLQGRESSKANSELIREASAAAIRDAVNMKRSDSDLSFSEEDEDDDGGQQRAVDGSLIRSGSAQLSASVRYMEEASYEAAILSKNHHRLQPSGRLGRQRTWLANEIIDVHLGAAVVDRTVQDGDSDISRKSSGDAGVFQQTLGSRSSPSYIHSSTKTRVPDIPNLPRVADGDPSNLSALLKSCRLAAPSLASDFSEEAMCLHAIFDGFCSPPLTVLSVEHILDIERGTRHDPVELPRGVIIQTPSSSLIEALSTSLLKLPKTFALGMFRLLLRLLPGNTDEEYDILTLKKCPWYDETFSPLNGGKLHKVDEKGLELNKRVRQHKQTKGKRSSGSPFNSDDSHSEIIYSVVRFRAHFGDLVRDSIDVLELILTTMEGDDHFLVAPISMLIGLLWCGGVAVDELRRIIALASDTANSLKTRLLMVRALTVAASTTTRSSSLVGKTSPRSFFSFTSGQGIARTINLEKSPWPFRNDFGMALWVRAEAFSESSAIFRVTNDAGSGLEVHFVPLQVKSSDYETAAHLAISVIGGNKRANCIKVTKCLLHPHVWYHVAVRHTRSRLKGVFSLSSREQLTVIVDGKPMLSELLAFPQIHDSVSKSLSFTFGETFDGQAGSLYVFHDNVSDATFKALFEATSETNGILKISSYQGEWDARHEGIAERSKILDLDIEQEILEDIGRSHRDYTYDCFETAVFDISETEESSDGSAPLSKSSFISKLYMVWDPKRTEDRFLLDLHSGAHVQLDHTNSFSWSINGAQQVIGSVGGVQAFLPVFQSVLCQKDERSIFDHSSVDGKELFNRVVTYSFIPEFLRLLSSYIRGSGPNATELLRCGAIEIIEQLLVANKSVVGQELSIALYNVSHVDVLFIVPQLSELLVQELLTLRASSSHYVALETRVFSRLLFNVPLWFGTSGPGIALWQSHLPVLLNIVRRNPEKVAVCVGARDLISLMKNLVEQEGDTNEATDRPLFSRASKGLADLRTFLSIQERHYCIDVLLTMLFQIFLVRSTREDMTSLVALLSKYLEYEWEQASNEISEGVVNIERSVKRHERYLFSRKCSTVFLCWLVQTNSCSRQLLNNFACACGSVHGGAAWILSSMVNSYCDYIRGIGVRCIVAYVHATSRSPDQALSLGKSSATSSDLRSGDARKLQENTLSLISNVGQGLFNSNVGKGLGSIGPTGRSKTSSLSKLTPRVVFKLLWHLLKLHRFRLAVYTQGSLVSMVFQRREADGVLSTNSIAITSLDTEPQLERSTPLDFNMVEARLADASVGADDMLRDGLGISTVLRLLRFLPPEFAEQWLLDFVKMSKKNISSVSISSSPDWQSCLFQFISELVEKTADQVAKDDPDGSQGDECDKEVSEFNFGNQFVLSLELYGILLGNLVRGGSEMALLALEEAAALKRGFVNGQIVFALILSNFIENISVFGVTITEHHLIPDIALASTDEQSIRLKQSAKMVTDAILTNGEQGMTLTFGVASWRCLRHLTVITSAFVTGLRAESASVSLSYPTSWGSFGLRLPEGRIGTFDFARFVSLQALHFSPLDEKLSNLDDSQSRAILDKIGFHLSAQLLALLDIFIFPEDALDAAVSTSQRHGLALVRGTETRLGSSQGPMLASLMRLSLLLVSELEPCSVKILQSCSRLRCFVHYSLELIRESQAMEGYSGTFSKLTLPLDQLLLATVIESHRTLRKCGAVLQIIESKSETLGFFNMESQKKSYRRLLRIAAELREILITIHVTRSSIFRNSLSREAYASFKSCIEAAAPPERDTDTKLPTMKESAVRGFLVSDWVASYSCVACETNLHASVALLAESGADEQTISVTDAFEKSLTPAFESYLERQRKWAETGAVRDLEFEGDSILKSLSRKCEQEIGIPSQSRSLVESVVRKRWRGINQSIGNLWQVSFHWKLPNNVDRLGRRIVLVANSKFSDHMSASYELMMGLDRVREQKERDERKLRNEISDLIKRNAEAFVPYDGNKIVDDGEDEDEKVDDGLPFEGSMVLDVGSEGDKDQRVVASGNEVQVEESKHLDLSQIKSSGDELAPAEVVEDVTFDSNDAWTKGFVSLDGESIVAKFVGVEMVTLECHFEGELLLSTHGVYFHQVGDSISAISNEKIVSKSIDRHWRLCKLTEVHGRRYKMRPQAIELFFVDCFELFLNFLGGQKERNRFYAKLRNSCKTPMLFPPKSLNPRVVFKKSKVTELWMKRKLTNFDYLMALNRIAGRTFNDIAQYPVFPWILADYQSEKIDLSDSRVYRDLSNPVGALNPDRLALLLERYNELESFGFSEQEKFLYGSHYSSPGVVLHFLIRQEPFTSMAIDLQSGRFDCPDRLFFDLQESWQSCNTSSSDVKELIPEFFTTPEILENTNGFPFGKTQRGVSVDNVGLPPWAKGSAHEFVRIHRLALESEHVSRSLHHWIDLIFGYKQRGSEAAAAHNLFHHLSYEGAVDLDKIGDEVDRKAAESHIQHFGQTPSQLLANSPHPGRYRPDECWQPLINNMSTAVRLRCHMPSQQFGGRKGKGTGAVASIFVQADTVIVIYCDLTVGTYKWAPAGTANRLRPEKLRSLPFRELSYSRSVIKRGSAAPQSMDEGTSRLDVRHWSFAMTVGGYEKEQTRRKLLMPSRLASAKDALYTDAAPLIVSCGYWDNTVKVCSTDSWKLESSETGGHWGPIRCLAIGSDGGLLVTGGEDCTCRVWVIDHPDMAIAITDSYIQASLGKRTRSDQILSCCHVLWGHDSPVCCVALSCNLDVAVSGSGRGKICVHALSSGKLIRFFSPSQSSKNIAIDKICVEIHGRMVIHTADRMLYTYTINGVCLCSIDARERINDLQITGEVLVTGGENCHVYIRHLTTLKVLSGLDLSRHGPIRTVSLTPDDLNPIPQHLFIGSDDGMISIVEHD